MLHHVSFNARQPEAVAKGVAELLGGRAISAPIPPFPAGSWFVCLGDAHGTLIEVMPWGEVRDVEGANGVGADGNMRERSGAHILAGTPHDSESVFEFARRYGWRAEKASAGLFRFIKVWVENAFLIECLTAEDAPDYIAAFGSAGIDVLDQRLREIEQAFATANART